MGDRPPFDPQRAGFWLIAFVIGLHGAIVLLQAGACLAYAAEIVARADLECDPDNRLMQLLAAALAAALAFGGVRK